jgi:nickel-dependent lactate racemase
MVEMLLRGKKRLKKDVEFDLGFMRFHVAVPDHADILRMGKVFSLADPKQEIQKALKNPISSPPLKSIIKKKLNANAKAKAVIVISDNTRPVPYSGEEGILLPIIEVMENAGLSTSQILILVATGTHRPMTDTELQDRLDPKVFEKGIQIVQHDCRKTKELKRIGRTEIGGEININKTYLEGDIRILTGLVESHFMAGVSGGRKSICPGLLAEDSIHILHSGAILASPKASDLVLAGNPVHEEILAVAQMAGSEMIVNVTLDANYRLTGVFAGDLEEAHMEAVEKLRSYAAIPVQDTYDLVITHVGYVGMNHYQAAKGALVCMPLVKPNGICILAAPHCDRDPIGSADYKAMMRLLGEKGAEKFLEMILHPSWTFVPEQWEAQMWAKLFLKTPPQNLLYNTMDISRDSFSWLPGTDARILTPKVTDFEELVAGSIGWALEHLRGQLRHEPNIAILPDGPYGIPYLEKGWNQKQKTKI